MIRFNLQYFATTKDLSTLGLSSGTHTIKVKAKGTGYGDSDFSNEVSYTVASGYKLRIYPALYGLDGSNWGRIGISKINGETLSTVYYVPDSGNLCYGDASTVLANSNGTKPTTWSNYYEISDVSSLTLYNQLSGTCYYAVGTAPSGSSGLTALTGSSTTVDITLTADTSIYLETVGVD